MRHHRLLLLTCTCSAAAFAEASASTGGLGAWAAHGFRRLPCRETLYDAPDDTAAQRASIFSPRGTDLFSLIDAYLASAGAVAADAARWPLDDAALVAERVSGAFSSQRNSPLDDSGGALLPHVARVEFPRGAEVHVFGDLHGAFHSLLRTLWGLVDAGALEPRTLRMLAPHYLLFMGDYVDRGAHGVETLALLLALKAANPLRVFLVRGNHESLPMNVGASGGFLAELRAKLPRAAPHSLAHVFRVYDTLPQAIYVGGLDEAAVEEGLAAGAHAAGGGRARFLQTCHGGLEVGYDPRPLLHLRSGVGGWAGRRNATGIAPDGDASVSFALLHGFARGSWLSALPPALRSLVPRGLEHNYIDVGAKPPPAAAACALLEDGDAEPLRRAAAAPPPFNAMEVYPASGFMWGDFLVEQPKRALYEAPGRGLAYGLPLTAAVLEAHGLVGVLRAHQHNNAPETGPMLDRIREGGGVFDNWASSHHVLTFLSGAFIPGMMFHVDAHGRLRLPSPDPASWTLHQCGHDASHAGAGAAPQAEDLAGGDGAEGSPFAAPWPGRGGGSVDAQCSSAHDFQCAAQAVRWASRAVPSGCNGRRSDL